MTQWLWLCLSDCNGLGDCLDLAERQFILGALSVSGEDKTSKFLNHSPSFNLSLSILPFLPVSEGAL